MGIYTNTLNKQLSATIVKYECECWIINIQCAEQTGDNRDVTFEENADNIVERKGNTSFGIECFSYKKHSNTIRIR